MRSDLSVQAGSLFYIARRPRPYRLAALILPKPPEERD